MGAVAGVDRGGRGRRRWPTRGTATLEVPTDVELPEDSVARAAERGRGGARASTASRMRFGGVVALDGVSLTVRRGQIFGIIGPNGAGKTTRLQLRHRRVPSPPAATSRSRARRSSAGSPTQITEAGVARTFQNIRLFPNMTALENVMVGTDARHTTSVPGRARRHARSTAGRSSSGEAEAMRLLEFVGIAAPGRARSARNLPYGDQRRLEIARAIATQPKVLLLDEPAAGFNPAEKQALVGAHPPDPRRRPHRGAHRARHGAW